MGGGAGEGRPAAVLVGLDYGRKRIGIAVSTPLGTVHPRERLERDTLEGDLAALCALAEEAGAEGIVIGLPHHMDGKTSDMEREARAFAQALADACGLPVFGSDERLTTEAADSALRQASKGWRERKARRDSAAACIVLQDYLDAPARAEKLA
ncbi:MAG TPA: Holliday junction resolvase RuvX [Planctomycetota bacterium]|nr:Holliday junction resolvase RuvX [Planctomycetota bacterium]